jgi:hypothetical protein
MNYLLPKPLSLMYFQKVPLEKTEHSHKYLTIELIAIRETG